jgi:5-methyltetrahydropteroyltriglutamate--homocysteine methyltransferase
MFTATKDVMLPTTVTGSWPRPRWYDTNLAGQLLSTRLNDTAFREQFLDATKAVVSDQERVGLDVLVNGDYHLDEDLGGGSWILYPLERLAGVDLVRKTSNKAWTHPPGTLLNEVMGGWRFPPVVDKLELGIPYEFEKIWRFTQGLTDKPVKFGTIAAQTAAAFIDNKSDHYDDDKKQLTLDMADILNKELRVLVAAGCKVIQIEDPLIHFVAKYNPSKEYLDFLIEALNRETAGLEDCEVWMHTCWGNPNMQRVGDDTSYGPSLEYYMDRVNCDVLTVEMRDRNFADLELFGNYRSSKKKVAVGIVSHRTLQADDATEIAANIRKCLKFIEPEKLVLSSDCGFGRAGFNRAVAYHKAAAIVRGANIVRGELGLPVTKPRNDDSALQLDVQVEPSREPSKKG